MGFQEISIRHLPAFIAAFREQGINDASIILEELTLIDRMLVSQKTYFLLNRKRGLKAELDALIGDSLGIKNTVNLNTKKR